MRDSQVSTDTEPESESDSSLCQGIELATGPQPDLLASRAIPISLQHTAL